MYHPGNIADILRRVLVPTWRLFKYLRMHGVQTNLFHSQSLACTWLCHLHFATGKMLMLHSVINMCVWVCVCVNNVCTLRDACTFFKHFQAEDRAHRHGQKRPVNIYIFCAKVPVCHELVIFLIIAPESPCIAFTSFLIYLSRILRMRNSGNSLIEVCFVFLLLWMGSMTPYRK